MDEEFDSLDLGDPRRDRRAKELLKRFAALPTASIPGACDDWSQTIAAYRFLGNEQIDWRDVMQPHWERTAARAGQFPVVLCIADTTELNFNGQEMDGLGPLSYEAQRGMFLHPTYAVTPDREPLGVIDAWMWAREPKDANGNRGGIKESVRWIEGYERVAEQAALLPQTRLVYVTDREGDIAELMARAQELGQPADWLIRSQHNRNLAEGGKLWDSVDASPVLGEITFILPGRAGQKAREVKQELRAKRMRLPGLDGPALTCVEAREIGAPAGVKPVVWRLLTNREAQDADAVIELVDWYRARWEVEMFFHVLKTGCKVEALQLSHIDRVERALALYMVVAWRIARLMRLGRTCPDLDASLFFDADEIRGAYVLAKKARPKTPVTLNQMIRLVASLGGFLGRKSDGEPGAKTVWIGMQRTMDAALTIQALREESSLLYKEMSLTPLQNGLAGIAPRTRGARKRKPVLHRWHYTEIAIHSSLRYPDLFAFLRIVVNARLEMNRLRYSVSLSYEVMDPMADFLLNIEAARTSRQVVVAEQLTFPPVNSDHPLHGCGAVQPPA